MYYYSVENEKSNNRTEINYYSVESDRSNNHTNINPVFKTVT